MRKTLLLLLVVVAQASAQSITGTFKNYKNKEIVLMEYSGFKIKELSKTTTDSLGNFKINYPTTYIGAALMQIKEGANIIVLLNNENFEMQWNDSTDFKTLQFINSPENEAFSKGMTIGQEADMRLAGLTYVVPFYEKSQKKLKWLQKEIALQERAYTTFLTSLPKDSYAKHYLQIRKLIVDMPQTAYRYIERMPQHEKDFTNLDFNHDYLWHSGLLSELFDGFYLLLESHIDAAKFLTHANVASNAWIYSLKTNPTKLQEVGEYVFKLLEKRSQYKAAEHIALSILNQSNCSLDTKKTSLFEQYRKMAIGNTAPNIILNKPVGGKKTDLKELANKYKLVVFGASWCPNCQKDYVKLKEKYKNLKETYNLEIVYISIDTDKTAFENYYKDAPFITYCDAQGWETQAAKDYYVFATPTYILLDNDLKIVAKLNSPEHLQAWLEAR